MGGLGGIGPEYLKQIVTKVLPLLELSQLFDTYCQLTTKVAARYRRLSILLQATGPNPYLFPVRMIEVRQNDSVPSQMQVYLQRGEMDSRLLHRAHRVVVVECTLV